MWARVEDGAVVETRPDKPSAVISGHEKSDAGEDLPIWTSGAESLTPAQLANVGWYEVVDIGPRHDPTTQDVVGAPTYAFADGEVRAVYDVVDVPIDELRTRALKRIEGEAEVTLAQTDRDVLAAFEDAYPDVVPQNVRAARAEARQRLDDAKGDVPKAKRADFTPGGRFAETR